MALSLSRPARALGAVLDRLGAEEARRLAAPVAKHLLEQMYLIESMPWPDTKQGFRSGRMALSLSRPARALGAVLDRLGAEEARRFAAPAAKLLAERMVKINDPIALDLLAEALVAVSAQLGAEEARRLVVPAAKHWVERLAKGTGVGLSGMPLGIMYRMYSSLGADEATLAAEHLVEQMAEANPLRDPLAMAYKAKALGAVSAQLKVEVARRFAAHAAELLAKRMAKVTNSAEDPGREIGAALASEELGWLAEALAVVSGRLGADEAAPVAEHLVEPMAKVTRPDNLCHLAEAFAAVSARLRADEARRLAAPFAKRLLKQVAVATHPGDLERLAKAAALMSAHLHEQDLVDILKVPLCVGRSRDAVLLQLGQRTNRQFKDLWDFIDWVRANDPDIDLNSPPRRLVD
jgi:hypothetical protein